MEDIQTSVDKIMAQFNSSITHSAPKKLNFGVMNESFTDSNAGVKRKRKVSDAASNSSQNGIESLASSSSSTLNVVPPPSPWETKRMKIDLLDAQVRLVKLREEMERQQKLHREKEVDYESKIAELKHQYSFASNKVEDIENHLQTVRKREQAAQQEVSRLQKNVTQQKRNFEDTILKLQREKYEVEENARDVEMSLNNELSENRRQLERLELEYDTTCEEVEQLRMRLDDYKSRVEDYDELKAQSECDQLELERARSRIKQLEYEISSYDDWKEITEVAQKRLLRMPDLDEELERLRSNNKHLRDLLGNKLLLEERVHDLTNRLEKYEDTRTEAATLQVKLAHTEKELKEWVKVAQDHCSPNTLICPFSLRSRIEQLLQNDIVAASEKGTQASNTKSLENQLLDYKQKSEIYSKNIEELNVALRRHKNFKDRVQKKLVLVSKERDCYKQLLDNFEKDLTVSNLTTSELSNTETQMRIRIDMLERALLSYKEMCSNLEKELDHNRNSGDSALDSAIGSEGYDHHRKELDRLRMENERLQRRKQELELELEHRFLRGDFGIQNHRILHLADNPANEAYKSSNDLIEKLQAEIERLKRRNKKLEEDNDVTQARLNETSNMTINIKEINQLRAELESNNLKMKKVKDTYKAASMEFREVCYMLFGYKVDRLGTIPHYKISSMYAESPDDYLTFRLNESSVLELLETPYSLTLQSLMETHLVGNKSLPVFLSSLTVELFQRSTITIN